MAAAPRQTIDSMRQAVLDAWDRLRRRRGADESAGVVAGGDTAEAQQRYDRLLREYAEYRILHGLGPDPQVIGADDFNRILDELCDPARTARRIPIVKPTALRPETLTDLLSSAPSLAGLLPLLKRHEADPLAFDQQSPVRDALRSLAERTERDPFIVERLARARRHADDFDRHVVEVDERLNALRMSYESGRGGAGRIRIARAERGGIEIVATSSWSEMIESAPDQAHHVFRAVAGVELAAKWLDQVGRELNRELVRFIATFIPRYFALLERLPRRQRRALTGGRRPTAKLAAQVVNAAETTDFVADADRSLGFERKALPRRFRPFTRDAAYRAIRDDVFGRKMKNASTAVLHRRAGTTVLLAGGEDAP
jgi:hypothetical protein